MVHMILGNSKAKIMLVTPPTIDVQVVKKHPPKQGTDIDERRLLELRNEIYPFAHARSVAVYDFWNDIELAAKNSFGPMYRPFFVDGLHLSKQVCL